MEHDVEIVSSEKPRRSRRRHRLPRLPGWIVAWLAAAAAVLVFGTPYLRVQYQGRGFGGEITRYDRCDYLGVQGWQTFIPTGADKSCPLFKPFSLTLGN